jgi:hypothetical protein
LAALQSQSQNIIISADIIPSAPRRLQEPSYSPNVESKMFLNMSTSAASGLWVGLFLLVMLGIAINILFGLKTHEKFARQNLWVGRES